MRTDHLFTLFSFDLKVGELSQSVESDSGIHLILRLEQADPDNVCKSCVGARFRHNKDAQTKMFFFSRKAFINSIGSLIPRDAASEELLPRVKKRTKEQPSKEPTVHA